MAVLITGGTKGIGLAIAKRFATPGVDIFIAYRNDETSAAAASAEIAALGARPHAIKADISNPAGPVKWPIAATQSPLAITLCSSWWPVRAIPSAPGLWRTLTWT